MGKLQAIEWPRFSVNPNRSIILRPQNLFENPRRPAMRSRRVTFPLVDERGFVFAEHSVGLPEATTQ